MTIISVSNLKKIGGTLISTLIMMLFLLNGQTNGQETDTDKNETINLRSKTVLKSTRTKRSFSKVSGITAESGNDKYARYTVHDGNLVTGGVTNTGILSHHYFGSPRLSWPKGTEVVSYLHGAIFYVAAEVVDIHGDTVHIVSDNYRRGNVEQSIDQSHWYSFMPLPKYFNLDQPSAIDVPEIYGISEDLGLDGIPNSNDEGEGDGVLQPQEDFNGNGELDFSMQNEVGWFAISHRRETWPEYWPAGSYVGDNRQEGDETPGTRAMRWNGEYGAYMRADQESYFVMDDRENDEFEYYPFPDDTASYPNGRQGLGITVEVRNYQWSSRLAEDLFISVYDITNNGEDLQKCVVGMLVDPDLGGSKNGDDADFDRDDDITYAWNNRGVTNAGLFVGYFGFAFLESPGLPFNGIDDDNDGMIDESQNNDIDDDGDWTTWTDENGNGTWEESEPLNDDLGADGLGPDYDEYTGPDADGTEANGVPDNGEPNYNFTDNDESDQVGLTSWYLRSFNDYGMADDDSFWRSEIRPGLFDIKAGYVEDIAWIYGSGFIKFAYDEEHQVEEQTHRYAISLLFGNDIADILRNKRTMQVIYDADYNFQKPPRIPLVTATGGDKEVFLTWDNRAEGSRDPVYGKDFEAYFIYKSTDPSFGQIKTITDGFGNPLLFKPIATFDLDNGLKGIHPVRIGSELGQEFDLGVSYNMGTDSGLKHYYIDNDVTNGRTYYYAVVSVDRGYHPDFYPEITDREGLSVVSPTECAANIQVDPLGRPISAGQNIAIVIPTEPPGGWVSPKMSDAGIVHSSGLGTGKIEVTIMNKVGVKPNNTYRMVFNDDMEFESLDSLYTGNTTNMTLFSIFNGDTTALGQLNFPTTEGDISDFLYEGLLINATNDTIGVDTSLWLTGSSGLGADKNITQGFSTVPRNYEIRVMEFGDGISINGSRVTNFKLWDVTDRDNEFEMSYRFTGATVSGDILDKGYLSKGDEIIPVNNPIDKEKLWKFKMVNIRAAADTIPQPGDVMLIRTNKEFDRNDVFEFTMEGNDIEITKAKNDLDIIYTVPDPYVALNKLERKVINQDEGRGDRRIDFVNLPQECDITIFTASGKLVRKIEHRSDKGMNRASWDLRTKDGLEITHGIYFYVVEAPGIGEKVGKFAVIK